MQQVQEESPKIRKSHTTLINNVYATYNTSLLTFHFEPSVFSQTIERLRACSVGLTTIENKDVYVVDGFFSQDEKEEGRNYSLEASFSRNSYGSPEAIEKGEKPVRSTNNKERWQLLAKPPRIMSALFKLFNTLSNEIHVEIMTLPWELCDQDGHASPAILGNFVEEVSRDSMRLGIHKDSNPEHGIAFRIPQLYTEGAFHPSSFSNGGEGKPWLISVMLYTTAENFTKSYQMGTAFYNSAEQSVFNVDCQNGRLVFFEGDILHSIEESNIPSDVKTWRCSFVFKLVINPRSHEQSPKKLFRDFLLRKGF